MMEVENFGKGDVFANGGEREANYPSEPSVSADTDISNQLSPSGECTFGSTCSMRKAVEYDINHKNKQADHIESDRKEIRDLNDSRRKFRVLGLSFPGNWMKNEKFLEFLTKCESFHMWFDKSVKNGVKQGGLSAVFETPEEAKVFFSSIHKMSIDGVPLKLQASKNFYDGSSDFTPNVPQPIIPFKINSTSHDSSRLLYALHLTSATDRTVLLSIIGSESIEIIQLEPDPYMPEEKQAEILFKTSEDAKNAREEFAEGFEVDDGDLNVSMSRLLTTEEYAAEMKNMCEKMPCLKAIHSKTPSPALPTINVPVSSFVSSLPVQFVPQISLENVIAFLKKYVDETRTNWAELNETNELWKLCDEVSRMHNGIPDSLLKIALLNILEKHRNTISSQWMMHHVDDLIGKWKKEIQNLKRTPRDTAYVASAAFYSPQVQEHRRSVRNTSERKRALATIMGVGQVLSKVRTLVTTEEGELELDEDEHGNYVIGGRMLTFESWSNFNKPLETSDRLSSAISVEPEYRKMRNNHKKLIRQKKMEEEKIRKMRGDICESEEEKIEVEEVSIENEAPEIQRELEEGEMSSESSSSSSKSSSSDDGDNNDEDGDDDDSTSRVRRRKRRNHKKSFLAGSIQSTLGAVNLQFTSLFTQLFEERHALVRLLSNPHKAAFTGVLAQVLSSPQGMTSAQQNQMNTFIKNFSKQDFLK